MIEGQKSLLFNLEAQTGLAVTLEALQRLGDTVRVKSATIVKNVLSYGEIKPPHVTWIDLFGCVSQFNET
jgi:hypothetical protein